MYKLQHFMLLIKSAFVGKKSFETYHNTLRSSSSLTTYCFSVVFRNICIKCYINYRDGLQNSPTNISFTAVSCAGTQTAPAHPQISRSVLTFQGYEMFILSLSLLSEILCSQNQHLTCIRIPAHFLGFTSTFYFIRHFKTPDNLVDT